MSNDVTQKDDFINCCPICGSDINSKLSHPMMHCIDCKGYKQTTKQERKELNTNLRQIAITYTSQKPKRYYEGLSTKRFGDTSHWKEIFVEEELSQHPLFDTEKYEMSCQREIERNERLAHREAHPEEFVPRPPSLPKCPACGSMNVQKISELRRGAHALAWGILSNTARAQFECGHCGYKF